MDRYPKVEACRDLIGVEIRNLKVSVIRHGAVFDPRPDLCHVVLAPDTGELGEHVRTELVGVGSDDAVGLVDPHDGRDVVDGVELRKPVLCVDQHGVGDSLSQRCDDVDVLVDGDGDHGEVRISEFVLQCLPPGQVEGASSPTGECNQQTSCARPLRQLALISLQVQERGVRRLSVDERTLTVIGRHADGNHVGIRISQ